METKPLRYLLHKALSPLVLIGEQHEANPDFHKATEQELKILGIFNTLFSLKKYNGPVFERPKDDSTKIYTRENKVYVANNFIDKLDKYLKNSSILTHIEQKDNRAAYSVFFSKLADYCGHKENDELSLWERKGDVAFEEKNLNYKIPVNELSRKSELDFSKPVTIYFGGVIDFSEQKGFISRTLERVQRLLNVVGISNKDARVYGLTYSNYSSYRKCAYTNSYNNDPHNFYSPYAAKFVDDYLSHLLTNDECLRDKNTLKIDFSKITLIGYSYGTIFVQEVKNALTKKMEKLGYKHELIVDAIDQIRAINIGSTCELVNKEVDFTQLHLSAEKDRMIRYRTNNSKHYSADPNPSIKHARIGNNLLLHAVDTLDYAPALRIINCDDGILKVEDMSIKVDHGHHPVLYMRANRFREGIQTVQANLTSSITAEFLKKAIDDSWHAINSGVVREGPPALDKIQEFLTPDNIAKMKHEAELTLMAFEVLRPKNGEKTRFLGLE